MCSKLFASIANIRITANFSVLSIAAITPHAFSITVTEFKFIESNTEFRFAYNYHFTTSLDNKF